MLRGSKSEREVLGAFIHWKSYRILDDRAITLSLLHAAPTIIAVRS
jgi:hypothetical protein